MKKIIALLLALMMIVGLVACGDKGGDKGGDEAATVKVGALYPFSGGSATAGPEAKFLIDMVVKKVNDEGGLDGLNGAKIEVIYGDTQADGQVALTEFERLVNVEGVTSLLGGYNTAVANTLSQYVIAAQVPMLMTSAAGNDAYKVENKYVYHANSCSANDYDTQVEMNKYWDTLCGAPRTSLVIYDAADYGAQAWEDKQNVAAATGNTVVGVPCVSGAADYSAEIAKIAENVGKAAYIEPTLIMDDAIRFMKQMHEKGVSMPIFASGGGYLQGDFLQQCGDAAEYVFSTAWYFADLANASYDKEWALEICDAFEKEFGYPFNENASCVWLGIWSLIDALERTTADEPEAIVTALEATDIKGEHPALLLTLADHVKYEDGPMADGTTLYNTNRYKNSVAWAYVKDGAYRVVLPEDKANKDYPLQWPIPAVADR